VICLIFLNNIYGYIAIAGMEEVQPNIESDISPKDKLIILKLKFINDVHQYDLLNTTMQLSFARSIRNHLNDSTLRSRFAEEIVSGNIPAIMRIRIGRWTIKYGGNVTIMGMLQKEKIGTPYIQAPQDVIGSKYAINKKLLSQFRMLLRYVIMHHLGKVLITNARMLQLMIVVEDPSMHMVPNEDIHKKKPYINLYDLFYCIFPHERKMKGINYYKTRIYDWQEEGIPRLTRNHKWNYLYDIM
jgi:hypothetical protein